MTQSAERLLAEFEQLPEDERAQVLVELLRRAANAPHDLPDDADLTALAERVFSELDQRERSR